MPYRRILSPSDLYRVPHVFHLAAFGTEIARKSGALLVWYDSQSGVRSGPISSHRLAMSFFKRFYQCSFCRCDLSLIPFSILRLRSKLFAAFGLRVHQCPHCFGCVYRPHVPAVIARLFKQSADETESSPESEEQPQSQTDEHSANSGSAGSCQVRLASEIMPPPVRGAIDVDQPSVAG